MQTNHTNGTKNNTFNIDDTMHEVWEAHNENLENTEEPHGVGG